MFEDRADAGRQLGEKLRVYKGTGALVLGIPRGGVEVAFHVAEALDAELSLLVVRKLPLPDNPEAGFGAIAEDGCVFLMPGARDRLPEEVVTRTMQEQRREVRRRVKELRNGEPLPGMNDRRVIIVDDGIAMGSTAQAAVMCCRNAGAGSVTVATPVAAPEAREAILEAADEVVVLLVPPSFRAVAEAYRNWYDVPDAEVIATMRRAAGAQALAGGPARSQVRKHGTRIAPGPDESCVRPL